MRVIWGVLGQNSILLVMLISVSCGCGLFWLQILNNYYSYRFSREQLEISSMRQSALTFSAEKSITSCPPISPSLNPAEWRNLSSAQQRILRSVFKHKQFKANCSQTARLAVVSNDAISRDPLDTVNFNAKLLADLSDLYEKSTANQTFVIFNMYAGTWPAYGDNVDFDLRRAILVKSSLSRQAAELRPQDISFPLFLPTHPFRGRYPAQRKMHAAKYLLTFKGKRYLTGAGVRPRNKLYQLHNDNDIIVVTTCRHGKDWKVLEDDRCSVDNKQYDTYEYNDLIANASFCLIVRGRRLATYRFLEVLQYGCIPVVIADSWVLPFSDVIDWKKAAVILENDEKISEIPNILDNISARQIVEMREQGRFLFEAYFSSIEQIVHTVIEILTERNLPASLKKPPIIWNRWPGALMVDWSGYSQNMVDFPFYYGSAVSRLSANESCLTAIVRVSVQNHGCKLRSSSVVQHVVDLLRQETIIQNVVVDNRCHLFDRSAARNELALFDANFYLNVSSTKTAVMLINPAWYSSVKTPDVLAKLLVSFKRSPMRISAVRKKVLQFAGGLLLDSVSGMTNCSGLVAIPDFSQAVIFHRYFLHLYATTIPKAIRDQAARIGHCEYLLFTALVAHVAMPNGENAAVIFTISETESNADGPQFESIIASKPGGTILCSCFKLVYDQFGYMPLLPL